MSRLADQHYPLRHRLFRALWIVCWALFAAWTPPPLHAWRCLILRLFGAKLGKGTRVYGSAKVWYPPNLIMADGAVLGPHTLVYCHAPVHLGRNAVVSHYAHLLAATHEVVDKVVGLAVDSRDIGRHSVGQPPGKIAA